DEGEEPGMVTARAVRENVMLEPREDLLEWGGVLGGRLRQERAHRAGTGAPDRQSALVAEVAHDHVDRVIPGRAHLLCVELKPGRFVRRVHESSIPGPGTFIHLAVGYRHTEPMAVDR